jgi:DNA gyrase/topoisomerase IV subunit A
MLAIDHGRPKVMNLKELLQCFIDHRFEVVTRRTKFELAKAEARAHILEGCSRSRSTISTRWSDHPRIEGPRRSRGRS